MKKLLVLPFFIILLFGCQNENTLLFESPDEAVISLEQQDNFAQHIQIIGQHSYNSETYYAVFEGTTDNKKEWFLADVKKDSKEKKWYVESSINIDLDESSGSGTENFLARVVPKNQIAQNSEVIVETTDSKYNVLVEIITN